ncbi:GNAT family N-acetyltransferase [Shewanella spartinae]|uniref:GNAT family N-acetyltransferase n=1 Tax=Shewanella spartinae TaxID=2864205 RepID=UPI001C6550E3|nr:GNAT family N-acetyltransferase [Shewanella spartinae]QYJ93014.1 GNAT family N-acetyltransferase [Shewanella spartinae]
MPDNKSFSSKQLRSREQPSSKLPSRLTHFLADHSFASERLTMRPIDESDKALYRRLYCDERVMRHIGAPLTQAQADRAFQTALSQMHRALSGAAPACQYMNWAIVEQRSQHAIGIQGLTWQGEDRTQAEIGIMLTPEANGKLYPEEAMGSLMEYAYLKLGVTRILANFAAKNLATECFVKKLGFVFDADALPLASTEAKEARQMKSCFADSHHYKRSK